MQMAKSNVSYMKVSPLFAILRQYYKVLNFK